MDSPETDRRRIGRNSAKVLPRGFSAGARDGNHEAVRSTPDTPCRVERQLQLSCRVVLAGKCSGFTCYSVLWTNTLRQDVKRIFLLEQIVPEKKDLIIETAVGESMDISIPANPTTGYMWEIEFCDSRLECFELSYRRTSHKIGGGGIQRFEVTAQEAGDFSVRFRLKRPWETEAKEVRIYKISAKQK